jgi:hypothetical protein
VVARALVARVRREPPQRDRPAPPCKSAEAPARPYGTRARRSTTPIREGTSCPTSTAPPALRQPSRRRSRARSPTTEQAGDERSGTTHPTQSLIARPAGRKAGTGAGSR